MKWITDGSFIGGGQCNMFCSSGGRCTEGNGFIGSGCGNCIYDGDFSAVLGGGGNCVSGCYSAVLGGQGNTVSHNYAAAFGNGISSVCPDMFHTSCLWLGSVCRDTTAPLLPPGSVWVDTTGGNNILKII